MAAKLSRSWSFFRGKQGENNKNYLHEDFQPQEPHSRVNLQQRFVKDEKMSMRNRPLPPLPRDGSATLPKEAGQPQSSHSDTNVRQNYNVPQRTQQPNGQSTTTASTSNLRCRQPLSNLPSGVLPLSADLVNHVRPRANRMIQEGGKKVNRALQGVRTSLSSFTQMFRNSTRRRYKLDARTPTRTPKHASNHTPRKTPGKLYSPFNVTTPVTPHSYFKAPKRLQSVTPRRNTLGNENNPRAITPQANRAPLVTSSQWTQFHSPSQKFDRDVLAMRSGIQDLECVTTRILRSGKFH
ncbi:uncharacterized protein LOC122263756 [Penaeus japonicus]|uniref:uncharacterized protein LOC122263756 n=1 Tax=Penaeus japonicus TaxID=27405 RepID=UPI001C70E4D2|nr:uncharacterized protein LOC122263756 [Penaeus japonicus]